MTAPTLPRSFIFGLLACLPLLLPAPGLAQAGDGGTDAGLSQIPDASVGEGGPDRDNPEGEDGTGRVNTTCRSTRDCSARFTCEGGLCRYTGIRKAETAGCMLGAEAALVLVGLAAVAVPRRRERK